MRGNILAFLVGVVALQRMPDLPGLVWIVSLFIVAPLAVHWRLLRIPSWACAGFVWALLRAHLLLDSGGIPNELEGVDVNVTGVVASLPTRGEHDVRFVFDIESLSKEGTAYSSPGRVRLSWREPERELRVGDRWEFTVRLKHPHGFMNPGGFDYEAWLYQQGIRATGYVRVPRAKAAGARSEDIESKNPRLLSRGGWSHPLDQFRQHLSERIALALGDQPHRAVVAALAIGTTQDFTEAQWDVFNRTGTTHLISISGLHIGFIAGVTFFLARWLWSRAGGAPLWWPAPKAAAVAAVLAAAVYAALAGFSVPTQRSLVMVAVVMGAVFQQRVTRPSDVLALSLLAVLMLDPASVLQAGFWLSFGAVAVILLASTARWGQASLWMKFGSVQWAVAIGMLPLMIVLFSRASVIAPLANVVAVPWFNVFTVPLSLLGALMITAVEPVGVGLLHLAQWSIVPMWWMLDALAATPWAQWTQHVPPTWTVAVAIAGAVWLLLPRGFPARWIGAVMIAPMLLVKPAAPRAGEFWLTLLDVGQGLAAVVRTESHVLVYDTGPRFSEHFDTGDAVVIPFLRHLGVQTVDRLILSHADSDHVGGVRSILGGVRVAEVWSGMPVTDAPAALPCEAPSAWTWDGVEFALLYPPAAVSGLRHAKDNDVSCVLRVSAPGGSALLTGDIEARSERFLIEREAPALSADVLVVPHHGSATSSTDGFIRAVNPRYALFPVGYRNRFGFPKPAVAQRYRDANIASLDTATRGALTLRATAQGWSAPESYRLDARRYWTHLPAVPSELKK